MADLLPVYRAVQKNQDAPVQGVSETPYEQPQKLLLSVKELAYELGKSEQSIRRLMNEGVIPCVKIGNRLYCRRVDFNALINGNEMEL